MFNNIKTKHLFIAFVGLLAIVLLTIPANNKKKNHSFKSELTSFDTAEVTKFIIYPKSKEEAITFSKENNNWSVSDKDGSYNANNGNVKNMLQTLSSLKAKRLAAKKKESWKKYELTDSLRTRVKVFKDKKSLADVSIGKFSYIQGPKPQNPYQRPQGVMTSFVKLGNDKEVYAVDGFLSMTFNRKINEFRDSRVLYANKDDLKQISFHFPDNDYTLTKNDSIWMIDGLKADSASVANFLTSLKRVNSTDFISDNNVPEGNPDCSLILTGKNGTELAHISAFYSDTTHIVISSSINEGTYFDGKNSGLFSRLFKTKSEFIYHKQS